MFRTATRPKRSPPVIMKTMNLAASQPSRLVTRTNQITSSTQIYSPAKQRPFSQTTSQQLRTSELQPSHFKSLRSNSSRIWSDIHSTARWGTGRTYGDQPTQTGLSRLTLSQSDKSVRDWFVQTTQDLGCTVHIDEIGNIFAIRPGLNNDASATFAGSHLDSQPAGGRFDGVLGVCAGVEMLRVLNENWIETEGPVGVVNWTNEEGARFPISMMGSGVWAHPERLDDTYALKEVGDGGKTVLEELNTIGYKGVIPVGVENGVKLGGHFELHIEQGPMLIKNEQPIGVVQGVQAYKWFEIEVTGRASHSGSTGFKYRADALLYASQIVCKVREIATQLGGLATVGILRADPGSVNTTPEHVFMTLDVRHHTDKQLESLVTVLHDSIRGLETEVNELQGQQSGPKIKIDIRETFKSPAVQFNDIAIDCITQSAEDVTGASSADIPKMLSGAGHDSVHTSKHCPTAMIFVPCKEGISHHPEEWSEQEHCAIGTDVLLQSVLRYDKWRFNQGHSG